MTETKIKTARAASGSEKRQRRALLPSVRCSDAQRAAVEEAASRAGLSIGSFMLAVVLKAPPPRGARVPPIERQALAQILAQLGRLNGNVNQIAKALNFGQFADSDDLKKATADIVALRDQLRAALGRGGNDN